MSHRVGDDRMVSKLSDSSESHDIVPAGVRAQTFLPELECPEICVNSVLTRRHHQDPRGGISPVVQKSQISSRSPVPASLMESPSEGSGSR